MSEINEKSQNYEKTNSMLDKAKEDESKYKQYKMEVIKRMTSIRKELDTLRDIEADSGILMAQNKFKEAKLTQEYNSLINSAKGYDLTLKEISLLVQILEGKIDKFERSKGLKQIRQNRDKLDKQNEFIYSRDEIEKCKKAIQMYQLEGKQDKVEEYSIMLKTAQSQYKYAKKEIENDRKNQKKHNDTKENDNKIGQVGYSVEQKGTVFEETQEQVLKDYSGNELGNRVISWNEDIQKGTKEIKTIGNLENEDGKYVMKEISKGVGGELTYLRKEMTVDNKITGEKEQYAYQKDNKGNEIYYRIADGRTTFRIVKNDKGTTIENYDVNGNISDIFEYDKEGKALNAMGEIEEIDENYVQNFFDNHVPYFEAENRDLKQKETGKKVLESAVKATEGMTRTSVINKQVENIRNIKNMRDQKKDRSNEEKSI